MALPTPRELPGPAGIITRDHRRGCQNHTARSSSASRSWFDSMSCLSLTKSATRLTNLGVNLPLYAALPAVT